MRKIDSIIIHCSATQAGQDFTAGDIDRWHRERGFNGIGYHYVIRLNGQIEKGRDISLSGAHCTGWNERSIGICYIGGLDANGHPADTRTTAQKRVLYQLIMDLQREYDILQVLGHRDTSPDLNGNGVIEPSEYVKACPCFSVKEFMRSGRELLFVLLVGVLCPMLLGGCRSGKEVINRNSQMEVDSSLQVVRGRKLVEQSIGAENDSEVLEEHVEQTVFVFPSSGDSVSLKSGMMVRTVVDRKIGKERKVVAEKSLVERDSVYADSRVRVREKEEVELEKVDSGSRGSWWMWMLAGMVAAGFLSMWIGKRINR